MDEDAKEDGVRQSTFDEVMQTVTPAIDSLPRTWEYYYAFLIFCIAVLRKEGKHSNDTMSRDMRLRYFYRLIRTAVEFADDDMLDEVYINLDKKLH